MFVRQRCDCCVHYVWWLSFRGWCSACEREYAEVGKKARDVMKRMTLQDAVGVSPDV